MLWILISQKWIGEEDRVAESVDILNDSKGRKAPDDFREDLGLDADWKIIECRPLTLVDLEKYLFPVDDYLTIIEP